MEKVIKRFNMLMNSSILMLILDFIVGILLVVKTDFMTKICAVLIGGLLIVHGLFNLIRYFYDGLGNRFFFPELISGLVGIILGIFAFLNVTNTLSVLGTVFGIWIIVYGLEKSYYAWKFMKVREEIYPLVMFISILFIIMGALTIFNPFSSFMIITKLIGVFVCVSALLDIMTCMLFKRRSTNLLKLFD